MQMVRRLLVNRGNIFVGIGGWTYEPWRGVFYPKDLPQKRELEFASRALTSIEINGTYYSLFKPPTWIKWREETPDGFVFAIKGSRYCTNRKELAEAGGGVARFIAQGLGELRDRLGPINWQFMGTKKFDARNRSVPEAAAEGSGRPAAAARAGAASPKLQGSEILRSGAPL
jgi:uncharacterized protein YecE (DUF72 family)